MNKSKQITIKDVAHQAGVSTATVSRYLNKKLNEMSPKTAKKIERAINDLNYTRNTAAVQLVSRKSNLVAVVVNNIDEYFAASYFKGIVSILRIHGLTGVLFDSNSDIGLEKSLLNSVRSQNFSGLIFQPLSVNYEVINQLQQSDFPIVLIDRLIKNSLPISSVTTNNFQVTKEAMEYFYNQGFDKVTIITDPVGQMSTRVERVAAIQSVFSNVEIIEIDSTHIDMNSLKKNINVNNDKNLLFVMKESILIQLISTPKYRDLLSLSNKQRITGFIDTQIPKYILPNYKFIQQSPFYMGAAAAEIMVSEIMKKTNQQTTNLIVASDFK